MTTDAEYVFAGYIRHPNASPASEIFRCKLCGSLVDGWDRDLHQQWHTHTEEERS
jgi:hypothetical protein